MQITANFKIAQSDCLQNEWRIIQRFSNSQLIFVTILITPSFLVLTAMENGFILPHKNRSGQICKALQFTEFFWFASGG